MCFCLWLRCCLPCAPGRVEEEVLFRARCPRSLVVFLGRLVRLSAAAAAEVVGGGVDGDGGWDSVDAASG